MFIVQNKKLCVLFKISLSYSIASCTASRWLQYGPSSNVGFGKGISCFVRYLGTLRFQNEPQNIKQTLEEVNNEYIHHMLIVAQPFLKFAAVYGTCRFFTTFTTVEDFSFHEAVENDIEIYLLLFAINFNSILPYLPKYAKRYSAIIFSDSSFLYVRYYFSFLLSVLRFLPMSSLIYPFLS
jgi:hypothetical protein